MNGLLYIGASVIVIAIGVTLYVIGKVISKPFSIGSVLVFILVMLSILLLSNLSLVDACLLAFKICMGIVISTVIIGLSLVSCAGAVPVS